MDAALAILIGALKIAFGFTLIIGIHELGHTIAALLCGVKIKRFSLGMGPGFTIKNVRWFNELTISPIVIGGYVQMDMEMLNQKSFWQRFFVFIAGMLANVLLAILIFTIAGHNVLNSAVGCFFFWLAGWPIFLHQLFSEAITVQESLGGPVMIGQMMTGGEIPYLKTLAMINLAIAMFNLLPLPPLDGGHIFVDILKKIIGEKAGNAVGKVLMSIGVVAIILLLVYVTRNDILRIA